MKIVLHGKTTPFKLDTIAEVTAISPDTYHSLQNIELTKVFSGPSRKLLKVIGQIQRYFIYRTRQTSKSVFIVKGLKINLLGLPTITALNLAVRVDSITDIFEKTFQSNFRHCSRSEKLW